MRDETVQLISEWQKSSPHGLDAMASKITGDTFTIPQFNSVDDKGLITEDINPPILPSWCIWADSTLPATPEGGYAVCRQVVLCAGLVTASTADVMASRTLANITTRACLLTMYRFNSLSKSENFRERNGIRILKLQDVQEDLLVMAKGRRRVWGLSWIRLVVADTLTRQPF